MMSQSSALLVFHTADKHGSYVLKHWGASPFRRGFSPLSPLGIEPRTSSMLGKSSAMEPYRQPLAESDFCVSALILVI